MKTTLIIVILCLLFAQPGCKRNRSGQGASNSSAGDLTSQADGSAAQSRARALLEEGKELYKKDEDEKAMKAFQQAVQLNPELAEGYFRLALAHNALGQNHESDEAYKNAVEAYKKYLSANPKDAEAFYNLGQTYAGLHLYSEAAREYRQAARLRPDDGNIYYDLGMALTRLAQYDEAGAAFQKCLDIDPENYRAQDALEEAKEGAKRIRTAKKYQEEQLKKKLEEEQKKLQETSPTPN
jgi:tetratricopeptide (TPR) repeat protein